MPAEVQALITHGLAKDPSERPQDVGAFVAEVERTAADVYGVDWEERGRREIVVALWPMLPLLGLNFGGLGGAADGLDMLGWAERGEPGNLRTESGGPGGAGEASGADQAGSTAAEKGQGERHRGGVAAVFLIAAAVAFAGSPKNTPKAGPPSRHLVGVHSDTRRPDRDVDEQRRGRRCRDELRAPVRRVRAPSSSSSPSPVRVRFVDLGAVDAAELHALDLARLGDAAEHAAEEQPVVGAEYIGDEHVSDEYSVAADDDHRSGLGHIEWLPRQR